MAKSKEDNRFTDLQSEVNELKKQIDYLYELLHAETCSLIDDDDYYDGETQEIPSDIYDKIRKYCENKNFIFMGVA